MVAAVATWKRSRPTTTQVGVLAARVRAGPLPGTPRRSLRVPQCDAAQQLGSGRRSASRRQRSGVAHVWA